VIPGIPAQGSQTHLEVNRHNKEAEPGGQIVDQLQTWCSASAVILRQWNFLLAREGMDFNHHTLHYWSSAA
jgi:hypothetical protein